MTELDLLKALKAVEITRASLDPKTAPRWDKDKIEQAREEAKTGLTLVIQLLELELKKVGA